MDLRMPGTDGVEATRRLRAQRPEIKVVVLTTYADDESISEALTAGAIGYLTKDAGHRQIALAVRSAAAGQTVLDPAVHSALLRRTLEAPRPSRRPGRPGGPARRSHGQRGGRAPSHSQGQDQRRDRR